MTDFTTQSSKNRARTEPCSFGHVMLGIGSGSVPRGRCDLEVWFDLLRSMVRPNKHRTNIEHPFPTRFAITKKLKARTQLRCIEPITFSIVMKKQKVVNMFRAHGWAAFVFYSFSSAKRSFSSRTRCWYTQKATSYVR